MNTIIVSDLHIGSNYFLHQDFHDFLKSIPESFDIVLNGDIINNPYEKLNLPHRRIMDLIEKMSHERGIVWVVGNHDNGDIPNKLGKIKVTPIHSLGRKLLIAHGHDFDEIMPKNRRFMKIFKILHRTRIRLGARPVHVAYYAKKWPMFYKVLRENVMKNAVNCALRNGFDAVTCGHTHFPEDITYKAVRYINTGAWTESPAHYLSVVGSDMTLHNIDSQQHHPQSSRAASIRSAILGEALMEPGDRIL